jgi:TatD DNase family protein
VTDSSDQPILVDSHVHLHAYDDWRSLLARATEAGVKRVVAVGIDLPTSRWNVDVAARHDGVVAAVGVHPSHLSARLDPTTVDELEALAQNPTVGFIGEIGIDTVDGPVDLETQLAAFQCQLRIARRVRKPVNLHLRGAVDAGLSALAASFPIEIGAICHYFVGDSREASRLLNLGLLLSVGKPATRPAYAGLRDALTWLPLDRLLLETDSYPVPGRTTEPADLPLVAAAVAEIRGDSVAQIARATGQTFQWLIEITERPSRRDLGQESKL